MLSWSCLGLIAFSICLGTIYAASTNEKDERTIRSMVDQAVAHLNKGDVTAFDDFWDARGADGKEPPPIKGRGLELVQKKNGRWRIIMTREMVIFKGN